MVSVLVNLFSFFQFMRVNQMVKVIEGFIVAKNIEKNSKNENEATRTVRVYCVRLRKFWGGGKEAIDSTAFPFLMLGSFGRKINGNFYNIIQYITMIFVDLHYFNENRIVSVSVFRILCVCVWKNVRRRHRQKKNYSKKYKWHVEFNQLIGENRN